MPVEIERKFLVRGDAWRTPQPERICQGYLNRDKHRTVRVRVTGAKAYLTVKGASQGATRAEFEYEVPLADAQAMLSLCDGPLVDKLRHRLPHGGLVWEVDEFLGENQGLVVAEVELDREDQPLALPAWVAAEVTDDARYFNSSLATAPYSSWAASPPGGGAAARSATALGDAT